MTQKSSEKLQVLAFAASNSTVSLNRQLVNYSARLFATYVHPRASIELVDINDYETELYSYDREKASGVPELARQFYEKIGGADVMLVSFAEHNGNYCAAWKNLFDWMSRIDQKVFQDNAIVAMATSPGRRGGAGVLSIVENSLAHFGADLKATVSIPQFSENFDTKAGEISNEVLREQMLDALRLLAPEDSSDTEELV